MDDMRKLNEMGLMSDEVIAEFQRAIDGAAPDQELQAVKRIMENGPARKRRAERPDLRK